MEAKYIMFGTFKTKLINSIFSSESDEIDKTIFMDNTFSEIENTFSDFEELFSTTPVQPVKFDTTESDLVFDNIVKKHSEYVHSYMSMNSFFFTHFQHLTRMLIKQHQVLVHSMSEAEKYKLLYNHQLEENKRLKEINDQLLIERRLLGELDLKKRKLHK